MYQIIYYSTAKGFSPVQEFLDDLHLQSSKDARIQLDRATQYIRYLQN